MPDVAKFLTLGTLRKKKVLLIIVGLVLLTLVGIGLAIVFMPINLFITVMIPVITFVVGLGGTIAGIILDIEWTIQIHQQLNPPAKKAIKAIKAPFKRVGPGDVL